MYRLVPCLAALVIVSLPACKRDRDTAAPESVDSNQGSTYSEAGPTPTPEQVCTRLSELATAELGNIDPEVRRETIVVCTEEMTKEQQMRGPTGWDGVARCVIAAQNDADIDRCDDLYPPAGSVPASDAPPPGATAEDQVCVIMLSTFALELMAEAEANGEPPPELADEDIRAAHAECLRSLGDARQSRTGADYDRLLDCLAAAESSVAMDQCLVE
jgi:hypothetical protein